MSEREIENREIQTALYNHQNGLYEGLEFQKKSEKKITPSQNLEVTSLQKVTPLGRDPGAAQAQQVGPNNNQISL